jgi:ATP-dependent Clp protease ATP-binding subunit ClpX
VSSLASKDNTSKNTKVKEADDKVTVKPKINVDDLFKKISSSVKSQDDPLEDIITTIAMNYECLKNQKKSHILVTGPTGSGKSEIMKQVSEYINVPIAEYDMTQVSVAGYVGKNVDDALVRLYYAANKDIVAAQNGILVLDEIDKKASHSSSNGDVSGRDVLNSLLKLLDGTVFDLEIGQRNVPFSTNNLTVVAMGAFATMTKNHPLGFTGQVNNIKPMFNIEDFVNFGMPAEFMGRMSSIIALNELSVDDLINILATSSISPLIIKKDILSRLGVSLNYTDNYLEAVAKRAVELKTGARSLKTIVYKSLLKAESAILRNSSYKELVIDNETVHNNKVFVLK